ncbi:hypothetical protein WJ971_09405 [Achromobacter xylosoxidans]
MPGAGLARAGIDFDVYERDARTDSRVQGYRLRIDASGQAALAHCLPPDLYALFQHSCSTHDRPGAMLDAQLRPLPQRASATWRLDDADAPPDRSAHRQTLREILLAGLDGRVHFGHGCAGMDDGGPRLEGIRARPGTLVVAADGVHSALRRQHLPQAAPEDSGTVTIFGMAPAGSLAPEGLPPDLRDGAGVVFGAGYALVLDAMKLAALPALAQRLAPVCALTAVPGYQYWAIIGERSAVPGADDAAISASQRDDTATGARWQQAAQRLLAPGASRAGRHGGRQRPARHRAQDRLPGAAPAAMDASRADFPGRRGACDEPGGRPGRQHRPGRCAIAGGAAGAGVQRPAAGAGLAGL